MNGSADRLFAALAQRDAAIAAAFAQHVTRVRTQLGLAQKDEGPDSPASVELRQHYTPGDVDPLASDTRIFWGPHGTPMLVGTVLREGRHTLLTIVDRSGTAPVVHEHRFHTPNPI